ncbi:MAG: hypothetical protein ACI8XO_003121, partial [Verrucomicrobiales bacterium]
MEIEATFYPADLGLAIEIDPAQSDRIRVVLEQFRW